MLMTAENRFIRSNGSPQQQDNRHHQLRRPSPDNNNKKTANTAPSKSQTTTNNITTTNNNNTTTTTNKAKPIDDQYYDSTRVYLAPIPQFHYYATNPPKALATNTNTKPHQLLAASANNQQHNFNDENYSLDKNQQPQLVPPPLEASNNNNNNNNSNNNNYNFHSSQQHLGAPPFDIENYYMTPTNDSDIMMNTDDVTYHIAQQIEIALHQARTTFLNCCQVSIPCKLTLLIAQDIVQMSESEPCGLRGCTLFINLEEKDFCQRIASFKFADPFSVATFEMYLTLKRVTPGWLNEVSNRILKNFGRNSIAISDLYRLSKKKLYRTASNQF